MKRLFVLLALALLGSVGITSAPASSHPSIDVVAANWKFTPATITLHVGETTELRFTSSEGVHGIESADLGIPKTTIPPGQTVKVKVTPKKAGTYVLHCAVICGPGHESMTLTVKVE